ncbi:Rapid alkalinization factor [Thalictrum thalictroides]|uniref:Rapid alkalinization factor n=1 Tax=Thalictrum thalictroides TaxID=46969 RepID=A0A7J6W390_THATH|nr:Rapid alkalinization factor [Thalictrum thalictroides]
MAAPKFSLILLFVLVVSTFVVDSSSSYIVTDDVTSFNFNGDGTGGLKTCNGLVGECIDQDEEMSIDSEMVRRSLKTRRFISYNALRRNSVPCNTRGASYYRCGRASKVNPYRRSCSRITLCARNLS